MKSQLSEQYKVTVAEDIVMVRQMVRKRAMGIGFNLVDQTKIVTATSELARNMLDYGGGGVTTVEVVEDGRKKGVRVTFCDKGPGIANLELAMKDGFTSGGGMGLGLGGAKRLSDDFAIETAPGEGTCITIVRWKSA